MGVSQSYSFGLGWLPGSPQLVASLSQTVRQASSFCPIHRSPRLTGIPPGIFSPLRIFFYPLTPNVYAPRAFQSGDSCLLHPLSSCH